MGGGGGGVAWGLAVRRGGMSGWRGAGCEEEWDGNDG